MEIQGFPNYLIYRDSRIWSNYEKGRFLKQNVGTNGYHYVKLSRDGKKKHCNVHRLIAINFIPNPDNKPYVDHMNRDKSDNRIENLRWVTALENSHNTGKYNTNKSGYKNIHYEKSRNKYCYRKMTNKKLYQKRFDTKIEALVYKFCVILRHKQFQERHQIESPS